ncbi:MAG: VCBS repeat-containing protein [Planctomycetota bacterium]
MKIRSLCLPLLSAVLVTSSFGQDVWNEGLLSPAMSMGSMIELEVADFDGDGDGDVLIGGFQTTLISWFENSQGGLPFIGHILASVNNAILTAACDVDGDGDPDIVTAWAGSTPTAVWLQNDGTGNGWASHPIPAPPFNAYLLDGARFADFDGDGDLDMVVGASSQSAGEMVLVYANNGSGFQSPVLIAYVNTHGQIAVGDLDGDGDLDLILPGPQMGTIPWKRNDSTPGNLVFTSTGSVPVCQGPVPADLDGDGDLDLMLVFGGSVGWSENLGSASFGPVQVLIPAHPAPGSAFYYEAQGADVDGDGDADLVVCMRPSNTNSFDTLVRIAVFENLGNGSLGPRVDLRNGNLDQASIGMGIGDLDQDGDVDVIGTRKLTANTGFVLRHRHDLEFGTAVGSSCASTPNSSGLVGQLSVSGSVHVGQANTHLVADDLPAGVFGYFLVGRFPASGVVPPGAVGPFCLGGLLGRFNGPGQILTSDAGGRFVLPVDLQALPSAVGPAPVLVGDSRTFQAWHRDPAWTTSNFTTAVDVQFE